jgi:hypothetical protein
LDELDDKLIADLLVLMEDTGGACCAADR